jgi:hypothetical protein
MHQYNVGAPRFKRIAIDIAGTFPKSESGNRYLLIAMDYFPSGQRYRLSLTMRHQPWRMTL